MHSQRVWKRSYLPRSVRPLRCRKNPPTPRNCKVPSWKPPAWEPHPRLKVVLMLQFSGTIDRCAFNRITWLTPPFPIAKLGNRTRREVWHSVCVWDRASPLLSMSTNNPFYSSRQTSLSQKHTRHFLTRKDPTNAPVPHPNISTS